MLFSQSSHKKKNSVIACKFLCLFAVENINTFAAFARVNKPNMHSISLFLSSVAEMESAPRNVQVRPLSSSTMVITWEPPETPNGQVTVSTWHQVRILNNNRPRAESALGLLSRGQGKSRHFVTGAQPKGVG